MATYNGERYLQEQLDSFLNQTRQPYELVVTDDCSSDRTIEILNSFAKQAPFQVRLYINNFNLGYSRNFEHAINLCRGDIIFISDQDDVWFPEKVETVIRCFQSKERPLVVFNDAEITDEYLNPINRTLSAQYFSAGFSIHEFGYGCCTSFRAELLPLLYPMPHELMAHDTWIHKLGIVLGRRYFYPKPLQYYRRHGGTTSKWFLSKPKRVTLFDRIFYYAKGDSKMACRKRLEIVDYLLSRIMEHLTEVEENLREDKTLQDVINELQSEKEAVKRRLTLYEMKRVYRFAESYKMYRRGDYRYFSGWMSLLKDLIMN